MSGYLKLLTSSSSKYWLEQDSAIQQIKAAQQNAANAESQLSNLQADYKFTAKILRVHQTNMQAYAKANAHLETLMLDKQAVLAETLNTTIQSLSNQIDSINANLK